MRRIASLLILLPLTGCIPEDDAGIVKGIREALWDEMPWWSVIWRFFLWTFVGLFAGIFIGIFVSYRTRRWGLYRLPWPRVRFWLTLIIIILNIMAMPLFFGWIGILEGLYSGTEYTVRHGVLGKKYLPKVSAYGADAVCFADVFVEKGDADWEQIQKDRRPVNVVRLIDKLDKVDDGVSERITETVKEQLLAEYPAWKKGGTVKVVDVVLRYSIRYLLSRKLQAKLGDVGVPDIWGEMKKEATRDGDDMMTHDELTTYLTQSVLIPMALSPVKKWLGGMQWTTLAIVAAWFATPPFLMFITRLITFWVKRRRLRRLCADKL